MSNGKDRSCKDNLITVSFKQTDYEQKLLHEIINASGFMGKSTWIKMACIEKLNKDRVGEGSSNLYNCYNNKIDESNLNMVDTQKNSQSNTFDIDLGF